ncbi:MAG: enoyl-CoA hydratase/isomerase family protein [Actinobacteria bacterium]|nr:enoyl-CoA hydratase/isomerase family protein [Actinomycetota bacterium]
MRHAVVRSGAEPILLNIEERIAQLTFNRPEIGNAVSPLVIAELDAALGKLEVWCDASRRAAALVVTGAGDKAFVSGADLRYLESISSRGEMALFSRSMQSALARLEDLPVPVIAALEGPALGGGTEVAWACDVRVMAAPAFFSFKYARVGVIPGWGGCKRLVSLVGSARALLLTATASEVSSTEAVRLGLAEEVVPAGQAVAVARTWAEQMASLAPLSVRELKRLLRNAAAAARDELEEEETEAFVRLWTSSDHREGLASLRERRPPKFQGR